MFKDKIYFKDIPNIGQLYLNEVFFEFENIPILFSCIDIYKNYYLCICSEIRKTQKWVITPISSELLIKMLKDKITIYDAFKYSTNNKIIAQYNRNTGILYGNLEFKNIEECDLPDKEEYLEDEDSFLDYINELSKSKEYNFSYSNEQSVTCYNQDEIDEKIKLNNYIKQVFADDVIFDEETNYNGISYAA